MFLINELGFNLYEKNTTNNTEYYVKEITKISE